MILQKDFLNISSLSLWIIFQRDFLNISSLSFWIFFPMRFSQHFSTEFFGLFSKEIFLIFHLWVFETIVTDSLTSKTFSWSDFILPRHQFKNVFEINSFDSILKKEFECVTEVHSKNDELSTIRKFNTKIWNIQSQWSWSCRSQSSSKSFFKPQGF